MRVKIGKRRYYVVFPVSSGLRHKSRIIISLNDEVTDDVERSRGLVKCSTYSKSLIRKALEMEPEENPLTTMKKRRRTYLF